MVAKAIIVASARRIGVVQLTEKRPGRLGNLSRKQKTTRQTREYTVWKQEGFAILAELVSAHRHHDAKSARHEDGTITVELL